jgi:hypothetical protein
VRIVLVFHDNNGAAQKYNLTEMTKINDLFLPKTPKTNSNKTIDQVSKPTV